MQALGEKGTRCTFSKEYFVENKKNKKQNMVSKQQSKQICFWDWIQSRATEIRATLKTTIEMGTDEFNTAVQVVINVSNVNSANL